MPVRVFTLNEPDSDSIIIKQYVAAQNLIPDQAEFTAMVLIDKHFFGR